jgi:hypothetical protein
MAVTTTPGAEDELVGTREGTNSPPDSTGCTGRADVSTGDVDSVPEADSMDLTTSVAPEVTPVDVTEPVTVTVVYAVILRVSVYWAFTTIR